MNRHVVVTGGSGFVGTNLVAHFRDLGWQVANLDIAPPRCREHLAVWQKVDLLNREQVIDTIRSLQPEVVLHFGARTDLGERNNLAGYAANYEGICNVIEAVRSTPGVRRMIVASSQLVCRIGYTPKCDYDYQPSTLYGLSKVLMERIIRAADEIGATWAIVRPTSLWGPWFGTPYRNFFETIARNLYVHPGRVRILKQWGFVGNSVHQVAKLIDAATDQVHRKTFYLADYEPADLRDFADAVQAAFGVKPIPTVPAVWLRVAAHMGDILKGLGWRNPPLTTFRYDNLVMPEIHDLEPLRQIVGPLPYLTSEGIRMTVEWLRAERTSRQL